MKLLDDGMKAASRLPAPQGGTSGSLDLTGYLAPNRFGAKARYLQRWRQEWGDASAFVEGYVGQAHGQLDYGALAGLKVEW